MAALIQVVLPVFLVVGFGYVAVWRKLFSDDAVDAVMKFAQNFAIPCLLFKSIATLDLGQNFEPALLVSFYSGSVFCFVAGIFGARYLFGRPWEDSVAIGFTAMFANSVLMGLSVTERAYGTAALGPNFAIVALHAPFGYTLGFVVMELVRARGAGLRAASSAISRAILTNPLMIGIGLGFVVNLLALRVPEIALDAVSMMAVAGLPAALFGMGGVLFRYRPEGNLATVAFICGLSLLLHPVIAWSFGRTFGLEAGPFRSVVLTAAMAPGMNAYIFASMYGVARRVVATSVLVGTGLCVVSASIWLSLLP